MNPALTNLILSLGCMQIARKIDFEDPTVFLSVRILYSVTQLICMGVYYYVSLIIKQKNDITVLKYVEPKSAMSQEPGALVTTTYRDYDLAKTSEAVRGQLIGLVIMGFLHLYLGFAQPLFVQSVLPLKSLYESQIVQLHLLGKKPIGGLKRPFSVANLFGGNKSDVVTGKKDK